LKNDRYRLKKSRYSSVDCYLSPDSAIYNDIDVIQDPTAFRNLTEHGSSSYIRMSTFSCMIISRYDLGIDHLLAQHVAHLFVRDTLALFEEKLHLDDTQDADHFEVNSRISRQICCVLILSVRILIRPIGNR
jgi:glutamate--cysteine ligase catalytic subunit